MIIGFRSNPIATRTLRAMQATSNALNKSQTQLSSGMRINSAKDDPAGLAVSMALGADGRVARRATLNINDGISALQIADGAYRGAGVVLRRMSELVTQAANGSFSSTQRSALNQELTALREELGRLRDTVSYNGRKLLTGGPVSGTAATLANGNNYSVEVSSDGRYVSYVRSNTLYQQDTSTGQITTVASSIGMISATSRGDYIAYTQGSNIMVYDRVSGTSSTVAAYGASIDLLELSDDGSTVAWVGRTAFSAGGVSLGTNGGRNLTLASVATGTIRGDGGANLFSDYSSLALSNNGSRVALIGTGSTIYISETASLTGSDLLGGPFEVFDGITATRLAFDASNNLVFTSTANVTGRNSSGVSNLYRSVGLASLEEITNLTTGSGVTNMFVTDNGSSVTFSSAANLVGENAGGATQLYKSDFYGNTSQLSAFAGTEATNLTAVSGDGYSMYTTSSSLLQVRELLGQANIRIDTGDGLEGMIPAAIRDLFSGVRGIASLDASSQRRARLSLDVVNSNIERLGLAAGVIGSSMSRLEIAGRSMSSRVVEVSAARGRILDADIAESAAQLSKNQILSDVQSSLLASAARLIPEIALSLLGGSGRDNGL